MCQGVKDRNIRVDKPDRSVRPRSSKDLCPGSPDDGDHLTLFPNGLGPTCIRLRSFSYKTRAAKYSRDKCIFKTIVMMIVVLISGRE